MSYEIDFADKALNDISSFKKSGNTSVLSKIDKLLDELREHPFSGTGKPEALKYEFAGKWSRRINGEHRLIYSVTDSTVYIYSARGHYFDK